MSELDKYCGLFSNLHVKITNGVKQPNKAIMLMSVMELIRCGYITKNKIPLDDTIKTAFESTWRLYFNSASPVPWTPFWHLKSENFWHFMPKYSMKEIELLTQPGETATLNMMKRVIEYAYLNDNLFTLLTQKESRDILISTLHSIYIKPLL